MQTNDISWIRATLAGMIMAFIPLLALAGNPQDCGNKRTPPMRHGMIPPQESMPPMGMLPLSALDELNLSETQQKQIGNLMQAQMTVIIEKRQFIRKTVLALHKVSAANDFDAVKAKSLADAHGKAVGQLAFLHAEMQARIAAVLTEEQRKQIHTQLPPGACR